MLRLITDMFLSLVTSTAASAALFREENGGNGSVRFCLFDLLFLFLSFWIASAVSVFSYFLPAYAGMMLSIGGLLIAALAFLRLRKEKKIGSPVFFVLSFLFTFLLEGLLHGLLDRLGTGVLLLPAVCAAPLAFTVHGAADCVRLLFALLRTIPAQWKRKRMQRLHTVLLIGDERRIAAERLLTALYGDRMLLCTGEDSALLRSADAIQHGLNSTHELLVVSAPWTGLGGVGRLIRMLAPDQIGLIDPPGRFPNKKRINDRLDHMLRTADCGTEVAVLDADRLPRPKNCRLTRIVSCGIGRAFDLTAEEISVSGSGTRFQLVHRREGVRVPCLLPCASIAAVRGVLLGAAAAVRLGYSAKEIAAAFGHWDAAGFPQITSGTGRCMILRMNGADKKAVEDALRTLAAVQGASSVFFAKASVTAKEQKELGRLAAQCADRVFLLDDPATDAFWAGLAEVNYAPFRIEHVKGEHEALAACIPSETCLILN